MEIEISERNRKTSEFGQKHHKSEKRLEISKCWKEIRKRLEFSKCLKEIRKGSLKKRLETPEKKSEKQVHGGGFV